MDYAAGYLNLVRRKAWGYDAILFGTLSCFVGGLMLTLDRSSIRYELYWAAVDVGTNPFLLEAILGAEVTVLDAGLQTCRALQITGIICTVCS